MYPELYCIAKKNTSEIAGGGIVWRPSSDLDYKSKRDRVSVFNFCYNSGQQQTSTLLIKLYAYQKWIK